MSKVLAVTGINDVMVSPFVRHLARRLDRALVFGGDWRRSGDINRARPSRGHLGWRWYARSVGAHSGCRDLRR